MALWIIAFIVLLQLAVCGRGQAQGHRKTENYSLSSHWRTAHNGESSHLDFSTCVVDVGDKVGLYLLPAKQLTEENLHLRGFPASSVIEALWADLRGYLFWPLFPLSTDRDPC